LFEWKMMAGHIGAFFAELVIMGRRPGPPATPAFLSGAAIPSAFSNASTGMHYYHFTFRGRFARF
jgi:hypothetical protein